jgi:hypothetical protein
VHNEAHTTHPLTTTNHHPHAQEHVHAMCLWLEPTASKGKRLSEPMETTITRLTERMGAQVGGWVAGWVSCCTRIRSGRLSLLRLNRAGPSCLPSVCLSTCSSEWLPPTPHPGPAARAVCVCGKARHGPAGLLGEAAEGHGPAQGGLRAQGAGHGGAYGRTFVCVYVCMYVCVCVCMDGRT